VSKKGEIAYKPIATEQGHAALSIRPPGTWFDNTGYVVFVGGLGVGEHKDLHGAEKLLLEAAKRYCHRRIADAEHTIAHYTVQLQRLKGDGLEKEPSRE
jgi:hypothetical protein